MRIRAEKVGSTAVLDLEGRLTVEADTHRLHELVRSIAELDVNDVVLDLGRVPQLDSSGIGQLVQVRNEVSRSGKGFMLVNVEPHQQRLLQVVRLFDVLHVCESRQEALARCDHMAAPEGGTSLRALAPPA